MLLRPASREQPRSRRRALGVRRTPKAEPRHSTRWGCTGREKRGCPKRPEIGTLGPRAVKIRSSLEFRVSGGESPGPAGKAVERRGDHQGASSSRRARCRHRRGSGGPRRGRCCAEDEDRQARVAARDLPRAAHATARPCRPDRRGCRARARRAARRASSAAAWLVSASEVWWPSICSCRACSRGQLLVCLGDQHAHQRPVSPDVSSAAAGRVRDTSRVSGNGVYCPVPEALGVVRALGGSSSCRTLR